MTLRFGLVGHGRWGRNILRTMQTLPGVSIQVMARDEPVDPSMDAVLIATPGASHAEIALRFIDAGVATFIEKPMATSNSDAERIRAAAAKSGSLVFIGHIYLHNPVFDALLALRPGLGAINHVICEGLNHSPRRDCSVLWDWLPHDLSMGYAVFGKHPESVQAWPLSGAPNPDAALVQFRYGRVLLRSVVSWRSATPRKRMSITGENGMLVFDEKAPRKLHLMSGQGDLSYPPYSVELPLTRELNAFVQAVRSGQTGADQVELGVQIVRAISAAEDSIRLGGALVAASA